MALKDIAGQDRAVGILLRTLCRDRVPSAYLFAGETGIGKRFTALNFAKALNCLNTVWDGGTQAAEGGPARDPGRDTSRIDGLLGQLDACDECVSCRKIDAMTHPDLVVVAPEKGEIRVGEIRAVEEALSLKPFEGKRKVVVVDDADAMNQAAANAFLKTLEEPPEDSLLMLISAHPDLLPETIRSRCCRLNFMPLSAAACEGVIRRVLSEDGKKGEPDERSVSAMVRLSMGRPGLAVSSDMERERERFFSLLEGMLEGGNETWADREEMEHWIDMVLIVLRDLIAREIEGRPGGAAALARNAGEALLNAGKGDFLPRISKSADIRGIIESYDALTVLKRQLGFNLNKAITWNYTASVLKGVMGKG